MQWNAEAQTKFEEMLADVPAMFRGLAQSMASSAAEKIAAERGASEIGYDDMIRGMIRATPGHMRDGLKQLFTGHQVDLEKYQTEFQA